MLTKMTNKSARYGEFYVLTVGYCEMYDLLRNRQRIGYNSGMYGWNWDCYKVDDVVIITGYRNTGLNINMAINHDLVRDYERRAEIIQSSGELTWEEKMIATEDLLKKLLNELKTA